MLVLMLVDPVLALCCCLPASWVVREVLLWQQYLEDSRVLLPGLAIAQY